MKTAILNLYNVITVQNLLIWITNFFYIGLYTKLLLGPIIMQYIKKSNEQVLRYFENIDF